MLTNILDCDFAKPSFIRIYIFIKPKQHEVILQFSCCFFLGFGGFYCTTTHQMSNSAEDTLESINYMGTNRPMAQVGMIKNSWPSGLYIYEVLVPFTLVFANMWNIPPLVLSALKARACSGSLRQPTGSYCKLIITLYRMQCNPCKFKLLLVSKIILYVFKLKILKHVDQTFVV